MKFLIDNQLPASLAKWLISHGCNATHVLEVGLATATDEEVWRHAEGNSFIVVTKDADFVRHAVQEDTKVQVVWVRLGNCRKSELFAAFDSILSQLIGALETGDKVVEIR
ncbi:MAG TPA: DUF5615 family PIN-like protein [Candidatus Acidoferrum sp.]